MPDRSMGCERRDSRSAASWRLGCRRRWQGPRSSDAGRDHACDGARGLADIARAGGANLPQFLWPERYRATRTPSPQKRRTCRLCLGMAFVLSFLILGALGQLGDAGRAREALGDHNRDSRRKHRRSGDIALAEPLDAAANWSSIHLEVVCEDLRAPTTAASVGGAIDVFWGRACRAFQACGQIACRPSTPAVDALLWRTWCGIHSFSADRAWGNSISKIDLARLLDTGSFCSGLASGSV